MTHRFLKIAVGVACLLACAACTPNATDFLQNSTNYDASGRSGNSIMAAPDTLTQ